MKRGLNFFSRSFTILITGKDSNPRKSIDLSRSKINAGPTPRWKKSENGHMPSGITQSLKEIIYRAQKAVK